MKKIELLAPAGDLETLKCAVNNGADAVYISGKNYGARKFAKNFTNEEIIKAIDYCHLYGVKIYVTVNTTIYENEIKDVINYITFLHKNGVDAVIMQDIGMISLVRKMLSNLEIHSSTQCHCHDEEVVSFLENLGVKRVVLAREFSLKEIKNIKSPIEKEVFVHGALCLSYSGQCYFSYFNGGRSGNRGECAQCCRLKYQLLKNDRPLTDDLYLLSTKDLCAIEEIPSLIEAGIASLKIEGRMKSAAYVGYVTKIYKEAIDSYYLGKKFMVTDEIIDDFKVLFNRGFTKGYLNYQTSKDIMNIDSCNHIGIKLGKVIGIDKNRITIKLEKELRQNDGIRFVLDNKGLIVNYLYDKFDNLINKAKKGDIVKIDNKIKITKKGNVVKTLDSKLENDIINTSLKKINVSFKVIAKIGKKLNISITDYINTVTLEDENIIEKALNQATNSDDITRCLQKLGNTIFSLDKIDILLDDNIFIPLSKLNEIRRKLCDLLEEKRKENKKEIIINTNIIKDYPNIKYTKQILFLVRNEEQLKCLLNEEVTIITDDYLLYEKYKNKCLIYYQNKRVNDQRFDLTNEKILASDWGGIYKYQNNELISSIYLNVTNSYTVNLLHLNNVKLVGLSKELSFNQVNDLVLNYQKNYNFLPNVFVFIYGKVEVMVTKYCPAQMALNHNKQTCILCKNNNYKLKNNDKIFPIINKQGINYILDSKNINELNLINDYQKIGINNFLISLYDEKELEIKEILNKIKKQI